MRRSLMYIGISLPRVMFWLSSQWKARGYNYGVKAHERQLHGQAHQTHRKVRTQRLAIHQTAQPKATRGLEFISFDLAGTDSQAKELDGIGFMQKPSGWGISVEQIPFGLNKNHSLESHGS